MFRDSVATDHGGTKAPTAVEAPSSSFIDVLKAWMLCGWIANRQFLKPGYVEVTTTSKRSAGAVPYVAPTRWTQLMRKCRARFRRSGCWDGQCMNNQDLRQEPLHYYKTDSYERNFDRGREFWEDLPMIGQGRDGDDWHGAAPLSPSVPDPVWMIAASQEDMKQKAAAIAKARASMN